MNDKPVRTRIAPSPTGQDLHIGNAYTALVNYAVARKSGGQFIIRIEDTDRTRFVQGAQERILASADWLGISHDEGPDVGGPYAPYKQSERLEVYREYAQKLVDAGHAFYCFCTPERLTDMRAKQEAEHKPPMYDGLCKTLSKEDVEKKKSEGMRYVIRMNVPDSGTTTFTDTVRGEISFENTLIDDQVLIKSDGFPTYHLGVVVDDHLMNITHIIRGEEWISSTPKHVLLYQFFGWDLPVMAHLPLLRNPDKSKLSKRKNPVWVSDYKKKGFLPEAIRNYLSSLAWSYPDGRDVFTTEEMITAFDLKHIKTTAPIFDVEKLRWMNGEYIRMREDSVLADEIYAHAIAYLSETIGAVTKPMIQNVLPLVKERMKTLDEFWSLAGFFYTAPDTYEKERDADTIALLKDALSSATWTHDSMEQAIRAQAEKSGKKARDVFMQLRIAVTGKTVGPPLLESLEILGKDETMKRLNS